MGISQRLWKFLWFALLLAVIPCAVAVNAYASLNSTATAITGQSPSSTTPLGQIVTFTATVTNLVSTSLTNGTPGGYVNFYDGAVGTSCTTGGGAVLLGTTSAQTGGTGYGVPGTWTSTFIFSTSSLAAGAHTISACYVSNNGSGSGWRNSDTSAGGSVIQTITYAAPTSTTMGSPSPSGLGQSAAFTATVTDVGSTGNPLTGIVQFFDNGVIFGSAATGGGYWSTSAYFSTSLLNQGDHSITAMYVPDTGNFASSAATPVTQTVHPRWTSTALASPGTITVRSSASVNVTVTDTDWVTAGTKGTFSALYWWLSSARYGHAATLLPDGRVLVVGGSDSSDIVLANGSPEMYTPGSGFAPYTPASGSFLARIGAAATLLQNGTVLIVGGSTDGSTANASSSAVIFDPVTNSVTATGNLNTARMFATVTLLPNGNVVIAGGVGTSGTALTSVEVFSGGSFTNVAGNLSTARYGHTADLLTTGPHAGAILMAGGTGDTSAELYTVTGTSGSSTPTGSLTSARYYHAARRMPDGVVLFTGGVVGGYVTDSAELYDPTSGVFTSISPVLVAYGRAAHTATLTNDGQVLLVGGFDWSGSVLGQPELYAPSYDPQGAVTIASDNGGFGTPDTVQGCTLALSGSSAASCMGLVKPNHLNYSTVHQITASYSYPDWAVGLYVAGSQILPTTNNVGGFVFIATTAGVTFVTPPASWPQSLGATVADFNVVWTNIGPPNPNHYSSSDSSGQWLIVNQQAISLTALTDTKVYDATTNSAQIPALTVGALLANGLGHQDVNSSAQSFITKNVGTSIMLSPYPAIRDADTSLDVTSDYNITSTTALGNITKAHLTVTASPKSRPYGAPNPPLTATLSGFVGGEVLATSGVTGTASCTTGATASSTVGPYPINCTVGTLTAGNYDFITFNAGTLTITKAHLTVTADAQSKTYDGLLFAGPYTATLSGFVNGETDAVLRLSADLSGNAGFSGAATTAVNAGSYTITPGSGSLTATNYDFTTFVNGTLTINKAHLTVTADDQSKSYSGTVFSPFTATLSGFVAGETDTLLRASGRLTGSAGFTNAAVSATNAGAYVITPLLGSLSATNYDFTTFVNGTLTINKAHLTVTADSKSRLYGAANPTLTATLSGFVNGEILGTSGVAGSPSCTTTAMVTSPVAGYAITCTQGTLAAGNYDFTPFVAGNLTITTASLTVTPDGSKTKVYGSVFSAFTGVVVGLQGTDAVTITYASAGAAATAGVGSYNITVSNVVFTSGSVSNYSVTSNTATNGLAVTTKGLTITANNLNKATGVLYTFTGTEFTASGLVNADTVSSVTLTSAGAAASAPNGPYAIVPSAPITGTGLSNYAISYVNGTMTVGKPAPTITWAAPAAINYGTPLSTTQLNAIASVPGTFAYSPSLGAILNAGSQTLSLTFTPDDTATYATTTASVPLTVNKVHLTVTADAQSRLYGAANPTLTSTLTGFVNAETLGTSGVTGTAACNTTATTASPAGTPHPITCTQGTLAAANYDFTTFNPAALTINKAHLTVTADNLNRMYGAANPTLTYTLSGFQNGENAGTAGVSGSPALSTTATVASSVAGSPYTVTVVNAGTLAAANYDFPTLVNGTLTVTPASLSITPDGSKTKVYGSTFTAFTGVVTGLLNADTVTVTYASTGAAATAAVGSYNITVANVTGSASNYTITSNTATNGLTVTAKPLTITANSFHKTIGLSYTFLGTEFTASGLVNADTVSSATLASAGAATGAAPGPYPIVITSPVGTGLANYAIALVNGVLTVGKPVPTITWAAPAAITYGTALSATQLNATADVPGTVVFDPPAGTVLGAGSQTLSVSFTPTDTVSYDTASATVPLTVNKAHLTVTAVSVRVYGANDLPFSPTLSGFVNGETLGASGVTGGASCTTTATPTSPVSGSPYPIVCSQGTLAATNYDFKFVDGQLTVRQYTAGISWSPSGSGYPVFISNPLSITYGTPLSTTQLNAKAYDFAGAILPGTIVYTPPAGTILNAGEQTLSVTFTPTDTVNFKAASATVSLPVNKAHLTVIADNLSRAYGAANPACAHTFSGFMNGENATSANVTGWPTVNTTATPSSPVAGGPYPITVVDAGSLAALNYDFLSSNFVHGWLTVTKAATTLQVTPSPSLPLYKQSVTFTATLSAPGTPTGTVTFLDGATTLGSGPLTAGSATYTTSGLGVGKHSITAVYSGDANFLGGTSGAANLMVDLVFQLVRPERPRRSGADLVVAGQTARIELVVVSAVGASGTVDLACAGVTMGPACAVVPVSVALGAASTPVSVTLTTSPATAPGAYHFLLSASLGGQRQDLPLDIAVAPAALPATDSSQPTPGGISSSAAGTYSNAANAARSNKSEVEVPHRPTMLLTGSPAESRPGISVCVVADGAVAGGGATFRLRNQTERLLTLEDMAVSDGFLLDKTCPSSLPAGESCTVRVTRKDNSPVGKAGLKITTDAGELDIPVGAASTGDKPLASCQTRQFGGKQ